MRSLQLLGLVALGACVADPLTPSADLAVDEAVAMSDLADLDLAMTMTMTDLVPASDGSAPATWLDDNVGLWGGEIVDVNCPSTSNCFAITPRTLFATTDGAAHWSRVSPQPSLPPEARLVSVIADAADPNVVYVATASQVYARKAASGAFLELLDTTDMAIAPSPFLRRLVLVGDGLYAVAPDGIHRWSSSTNMWQSTLYDLPPGVNLDAFGLNNTLFVARNDGLWIRSDTGTTWTHTHDKAIAKIGFGVTSGVLLHALIDEASGIWANPAFLLEQCKALSASAIGLAPWGEIVATTPGGYARVSSSCKSTDWSPFDTNPNSNIERYVSVGDTRLFGLGAHGLFKIEDPPTLQRSDEGIDALTVNQLAAQTTPGHAWAATSQGLYERDPADGRWRERVTTYGAYRDLAFVSFSPVDPQHAIIAASAGSSTSAYSRNGGADWVASSAVGSLRALAHSPVESGRAIACRGDELVLTTNDGADWSSVGADLGDSPGNQCWRVASHPTANVFFAAAFNRAWQSVDGGVTWQPIGGSALTAKFIRAIAADPQNSSEAYVVLVNDGLWRVKGASASPIYDPPAELWQVATVGDKVYVLDDTRVLRRVGGSTFAALQAGAVDYAPRTILIHPANEQELYLGSVGNGVRRAVGDWN